MRAFSLVEMIVVLAIVVLALAAAWPAMSRFQFDTQVNEGLAMLAMDLRLAASDSRAAWQNSGYGLKFDQDYYTVYRGDNYAARQTEFDRVVRLDGALRFELGLAPSANEISFDHRGLPRSFGSVTIDRVGLVGKGLVINKLGVIEK